jgi:predicted DNA-binding transcriptional regulator YafY
MKDILEHLEVSKATAKRDIEFLRDRMGVPVEWDAFGQGYRIQSPTCKPDGAPRELPGLWFTDQEVDALLTMYDLVAEADETGHVRQSLLPLRRRLLKILDGSRSELRVLLERARGAADRRPAGRGYPSVPHHKTLSGSADPTLVGADSRRQR